MVYQRHNNIAQCTIKTKIIPNTYWLLCILYTIKYRYTYSAAAAVTVARRTCSSRGSRALTTDSFLINFTT